MLLLGKISKCRSGDRISNPQNPQRIKPREVNLGSIPISDPFRIEVDIMKKYHGLPDDIRIQKPNELIVIVVDTYIEEPLVS